MLGAVDFRLPRTGNCSDTDKACGHSKSGVLSPRKTQDLF